MYRLRDDVQIETSPIAELHGHEGYISSCKFADPEHRLVLTGSGDATCMLWDVEKQTPVLPPFTGHTADVMGVAIEPTKRQTFVSASCDTTARVWDMRTGRCVAEFAGHQSDVNEVTFLSDGLSFITASDDSSCHMYDVRSTRLLNTFDRPYCGVTSVAASLSGRLLFAAYDDDEIHVYDTLSSSGQIQSQGQGGGSGRGPRGGMGLGNENNRRGSYGIGGSSGNLNRMSEMESRGGAGLGSPEAAVAGGVAYNEDYDERTRSHSFNQRRRGSNRGSMGSRGVDLQREAVRPLRGLSLGSGEVPHNLVQVLSQQVNVAQALPCA